MVKHLPAMRETQVQPLGRGDPLEKEMATHSSTIAWKIPWTEEPGRLQSMGSQRVRHDWVTSLHFNVLFRASVSLWIFCLDDLPIDIHGCLNALFYYAAVNLSLMFLNSCFMYLFVAILDACACMLIHSVVSDSTAYRVVHPHGLQPTTLLHLWNFPCKETGMDFHFLLQGIILTQESNPHLLLLLC